MALQPVDNFIPGASDDGLVQAKFDPTVNDAAALFQLTTRVKVFDTTLFTWGEVIYCRGVANTVVGDATILSFGDEAGILVTDAVGGAEIGALIGIALAAIVAGEYGWYQIWGSATCQVSAGFVTNGLIYTTTTPGELDNSAGGGQVLHARSAGSVSSGTALIDIAYPSIAGTSVGQA